MDRPRLGKIALALGAGIAVALVTAEGALRAVDFGAEARDAKHGWTIRFDRELLFRLRPHSRADINSLGFRDREFPPRRRGRVRILVLGDSFTMGWDVEPKATLPARLQSRLHPHAEVLNLGVLGYGPDQSLLTLERLSSELDPELVVLALSAANDFEDLLKNELFAYEPSGRLVQRRDNPVAGLLPAPRLGILMDTLLRPSVGVELTTGDLNRRLFADAAVPLGPVGSRRARERTRLMEALLARFQAVLGHSEVAFSVAILPSPCAAVASSPCRVGPMPAGYGRNEAALEEICLRLGLPYVNLLPEFVRVAGGAEALFAKEELQFSERGNEEAARLIAAALIRQHPELF